MLTSCWRWRGRFISITTPPIDGSLPTALMAGRLVRTRKSVLCGYRCNQRVVKTAIGFLDAFKALTNSTSSLEHEFWAMDRPLSEIDEEIRARIAGHYQLADGLLLDLAIRNAGKLATFN